MSHPRNAIKRSHDIALSQREIILRTPRSRLSTCRFGREFESHFPPGKMREGRIFRAKRIAVEVYYSGVDNHVIPHGPICRESTY